MSPWPAPGFKGLRMTAGRRPSNEFWLMVWEDRAEILRANPGRAMLNWGRHNAQCLPLWQQSGPFESCGHVEQSWAYLGLMLGQVGPMLSHRAYVGPSWAHVELCSSMFHVGPMLGPCWPILGLCWPMLSHLGSYVGAMFGPSMLKRS